NLILREQSEFLLPERHVAVPLVDAKQERAVVQIVLQRGEGECSPEVRLITEPAAADVRNVQTCSDKMLTLRPGKDVIELHMIFCNPLIGLRAAAGEGVLNDQPRNVGMEAARPAILMPDATGQFVDEFGGEDLAQAEKKMMLAASGIGG